MKLILFLSIFLCGSAASAQNYTSYFTGSAQDKVTQPVSGVCIMGGSSEDDNAMKWFLSRAQGGDILVLRASGSDGYNDYMYSGLGISINSVETIVCNNKNSASETYIQDKINKAEAIWFAGGDQFDYISYWQNTAIDSLIRKGITERKIVVGGTSAGMAIMGGYIYSGEKGSVTSAAALGNPYNSKVTINSDRFLENKYLEDVITDTHYDNPDRRGRHVTFLARILKDSGVKVRGIACDEYTAVCIDEAGIARVFGEYPSSNDNAYFISPNCALTDVEPEQVKTNLPLIWNKNNKALWVYKIKGTKSGENTFDLNDWTTGQGGVWEDWYVNDGVLVMKASTQVDCSILANEEINVIQNVNIYPNPVGNELNVSSLNNSIFSYNLIDLNGKQMIQKENINSETIKLNMRLFASGTYILKIRYNDGVMVKKVIKL